MQAVTFTTSNGNHYVYSPIKKYILPIDPETRNIIDSQDNINTKPYNIQSILHDNGYFEKIKFESTETVSGYDIEIAICNLPQVIFEVTSACNLHCSYCCYGDGYDTFRDRSSGRLSLETAKAVLNYLASQFHKKEYASTNVPFAISFYGGEPLLEIELIKEIVKYAKSLDFSNRRVHFSLTTNATRLAECIDFLAENQFHILVSLDGNRESNQYRKFRNGEEAFDCIMSNLEYVKEKHPTYFKTIRFNSVYTDASFTEDIISFFKSHFNKTPTFSALHKPDQQTPGYNRIIKMVKPIDIPDSLCWDNNLFIEAPIHKRIADIFFKLIRNTYFSEKDLHHKDGQKYLTGTCLPFSKRMFVAHNGEILPCEKVCREKPLAKVEKGINDLLINVNKVASEFNRMLQYRSKQCRNCYLQQCCTQCALTFKNEKCSNFTDKARFQLLMGEAFSYIENHPDVISYIKSNIIIR